MSKNVAKKTTKFNNGGEKTEEAKVPRKKKDLKKYRADLEDELIKKIISALDLVQDISAFKPGEFKDVGTVHADKKFIQTIKDTLRDECHQTCVKLTAPRPRKVDPHNKGKNGLYNPKFVTKELKDFVANCDFGDAYDANGKSMGKLQDHIPLLAKDGITCNATLTPVFCTYVARHNIQNPKMKQQIIPTPEFTKYFGAKLNEMKEEDKKLLAEARKALKEADPNDEDLYHELEDEVKKLEDRQIDPKSFKYARFPGISSKCTIKKPNLTDAQRERLEDDTLEARLKAERFIVSQTLKFYGKNKKDVDDEEEEEVEEDEE